MPRAQKVICKKNDSLIDTENKLTDIYYSVYKNSREPNIKNNNFFSHAFEGVSTLSQDLWDEFEGLTEIYEILNFGYKSSNLELVQLSKYRMVGLIISW